MKGILALDLATRTGWAVGGRDENAPTCVTLHGTWDLAPARGESPGMRFVRLRAKLEQLLTGFPGLALCVYEQAHHRGGPATEIAVGLATTVQAWCAERRIEHASVHTARLKKFATGSGRAEKADMIRAARERGWQPRTDHEADALHLLQYAREEIVGQSPQRQEATG